MINHLWGSPQLLRVTCFASPAPQHMKQKPVNNSGHVRHQMRGFRTTLATMNRLLERIPIPKNSSLNIHVFQGTTTKSWIKLVSVRHIGNRNIFCTVVVSLILGVWSPTLSVLCKSWNWSAILDGLQEYVS
jgi:hypothetical protein